MAEPGGSRSRAKAAAPRSNAGATSSNDAQLRINDAKVRMYKDAYEEGKRSVDDQLAELDSMRQRSIQFVAFVGSATGFLVGTGLSKLVDSDRTTAFYTVSISSSVISGVTVFALISVLLSLIFVVRPTQAGRSFGIHRAHWDFRNSSKKLVELWVDPEVGARSEEIYYRDLALEYDEKRVTNKVLLSRIRVSYIAVLIAGSLQITGWAALIWMVA